MSKSNELKDKLVKLFSKRQEVKEIMIFGKIAEGLSDKYSDIDIRIISADPYLTQQELDLYISRNISEIRSKFTLVSNENEFAEMIMLKDYSPYQKIDLGVCKEGYGLTFSGIKSVYVNSNPVGQEREMRVQGTSRDVSYDLDNHLFGIPRFTKCLYREDFDMYRRWKNMVDSLLVLIEESYFGYVEIQSKKSINAPDSKKLFTALSNEDTESLNQILPLSGEVDISRSFLKGSQLFVALSRKKATHMHVKLDEKFIQYMEEFASREISRFHQINSEQGGRENS